MVKSSTAKSRSECSNNDASSKKTVSKKKAVKNSPSSKVTNNTPIIKLPIKTLIVEAAKPQTSAKETPKLVLNTQAIASPAKKKAPKKLLNILNTLKDECENIDACSRFTSPALKHIQNPIMLLNNEQVGPIKNDKNTDGDVNLDSLISKIRPKSKENPLKPNIQNPNMIGQVGPIKKDKNPNGDVNLDPLFSKIRPKSKENPPKKVVTNTSIDQNPPKKVVTNTSIDQISVIKEKLEQMIKRHTLSLNPTGNSSSPKPYITNNQGSSYINTSYNQNLNQKHNELLKYSANAEPSSITCKMRSPLRKESNGIVANPAASKVVPHAIPEERKVSQSSYHQSPRDEIKVMRDKVDEAVRKNKIFTVCGNFYSIRNALVARGWIEKLHATYSPVTAELNLVRRLQFLSIPELALGLKDKELAKVYKQVIYSKMIGTHPASFYWDINRETYKHNMEAFKNTLVNFVSKNRFSYANKHGLCETSKQAYWFNNPGVSYLRTPRSYSLVNNGDPDEFIYDFKATAAMSFLKWIVNVYEAKTSKLISNCGKLSIAHFHFALQECAKFAQKLRHEDIDKEIPMADEHQWQDFLEYFYKAVHVGNHFKQTNLESELSLFHKSKTMLKKLSQMWTYTDMDGYMNIWLLKPSYGSRGIGIHFCRTLQYVLKVMKEHKNNTYVIQKYIERPLLIHNTKFDIRQWFLISSTSPITIWIYKECYLRFSSQTYNLRKLHESIHLTNNSVQSKYHNANRDPCLPLHNMWFLKEFRQHLANMGYPKVFDEIIYPGMKECITAAVLTSEDQICRIPNAFELHGADFMITEDFTPWLIEINSKPALSPSTPVTSKLCPAVLEDVIKVVIDFAKNPKASTGHFELLFKEDVINMAVADNVDLAVKGNPIENGYFLTPEQIKEYEVSKLINRPKSTESINIVKTTDYIKFVGREMKATLQQLLTLIQNEKERRKKLSQTDRAQELNSFMYCEDMERLKTNMKEMEEIFMQDGLETEERGDPPACDNKYTINFARDSDTLLRTNSNTIKEAISSLDESAENNMTTTYSSIMNIIGNIKFPENEKPIGNKY